jgi:predicted dehydrogenase
MAMMNAESTRKLNVGVLGCGPIAQAAHFEACRRARNARLYAICDVADDLLARMKAIHRPEVAYRDYDEMLADPKVDAVIVAIADQFHVWAAKKALRAGKHVLVEKPLGVSVEECVELRDLVIETGLALQVGTM